LSLTFWAQLVKDYRARPTQRRRHQSTRALVSESIRVRSSRSSFGTPNQTARVSDDTFDLSMKSSLRFTTELRIELSGI
jgi:hypothetical protein